MKAILATVAILLAAATSGAVTWHVAKDGSGDFAVIQDAVDAASDGDTIWIHAGRYEEVVYDFAPYGEGNSYRCDTHVAITKDNLTLRGDGPDLSLPPSSFGLSSRYRSAMGSFKSAHSRIA